VAADGTAAVRIDVADQGIGIPEAERARIFERFYRVDRARSREQGGTGLGLSIVKHLVQASGGEVWVESTPGTGSTFSFTLPSSKPRRFEHPPG
jgi:two-component system phosphate regulon sensor histidine kinase PhoR